MKEYGLILNHQSKISSRTISRRKSSIFFDTIRSYIEKKMEQLNSAKIKFHLRNHHSQIQNWSDDRWIACLAAGGGPKRRYQYCSDYLGSIIYLRALQGHSGGNLIDLTLQDNVLIGPGIFPYILPRRKQFQSLFNYQQWIDTWRSEFGQKTICILLACLIQEKKTTKIQSISTTLYHVLHDTCKMHGRDIKTRYFGSILILESEKD